jgi:YegS/Rv2252/BmrU family lipid kinase
MTALVVNPTKVDDLDALLRQVSEACARHGLPGPTVYETTPQDAGQGQAGQAVADGAELVLTAGGDGTVQAVCCGLNGTGVPLGILPWGTGNLLARNLQIPLDATDALEVALSGRDRLLDLGQARVGDAAATCFAVMAGLGFDAQMMVDAPEKLKATVGWPAYLVSGLKHLRDEPVLAEVVLDGGAPVRRKVRGVVIGNVGDLQGGVSLLPGAVPDDGVLDVVLLAPSRLLDWGRLVGRLLSRSSREDLTVTRYTARTVAVRMNVATQAQLDGEPLGAVHTMAIEVLPGALVVRVPR